MAAPVYIGKRHKYVDPIIYYPSYSAYAKDEDVELPVTMYPSSRLSGIAAPGPKMLMPPTMCLHSNSVHNCVESCVEEIGRAEDKMNEVCSHMLYNVGYPVTLQLVNVMHANEPITVFRVSDDMDEMRGACRPTWAPYFLLRRWRRVIISTPDPTKQEVIFTFWVRKEPGQAQLDGWPDEYEKKRVLISLDDVPVHVAGKVPDDFVGVMGAPGGDPVPLLSKVIHVGSTSLRVLCDMNPLCTEENFSLTNVVPCTDFFIDKHQPHVYSPNIIDMDDTEYGTSTMRRVQKDVECIREEQLPERLALFEQCQHGRTINVLKQKAKKVKKRARKVLTACVSPPPSPPPVIVIDDDDDDDEVIIVDPKQAEIDYADAFADNVNDKARYEFEAADAAAAAKAAKAASIQKGLLTKKRKRETVQPAPPTQNPDGSLGI